MTLQETIDEMLKDGGGNVQVRIGISISGMRYLHYIEDGPNAIHYEWWTGGTWDDLVTAIEANPEGMDDEDGDEA